jgi:LPXTG-motif cell wall-anchored protein
VRGAADLTVTAVAVTALALLAAPAAATVAPAPGPTEAEVAPQATPVAGQAYGAVRDATSAPTRPPPVKPAVASGGPLVTIADFSFRAPTITVRVGQTVTWTNRGPSSHTATAGDGSFDTGVLRKGASASHRFARAGTFAYQCKIHPFMKGTVRVVGASGSQPAVAPKSLTTTAKPSASAAPEDSAPAAGASTTASVAKPELPATGSDPLAVAAVGLAALAAGLAGTRLTRRRTTLGNTSASSR